MRVSAMGGQWRSLLLALGILFGLPAASQAASPDFNGDGYADLAIGVPGEALEDGQGAAMPHAGAVQVLYGTSAGLSAASNQFWHQDSPGIKDKAEPGDSFGRSLGKGDFNGDGYTDLAIGVPLEGVGAAEEAGLVQVLYGSAAGLTAASNQVWHQNRPQVKEKVEASDAFGLALAAGDFDGDGYDELAIGSPQEDVGGVQSAGVVQVLYGSARGLRAARNQLWHEASKGINGAPSPFSGFGAPLACGDFNDDGKADLAVGAAHGSLGAVAQVGTARVLYGSARGLTAAGNQHLHQIPGVLDETPEPGDRFGAALAAGDFNGDGSEDLAVGVPGEGLGGSDVQVGLVHVLYGGTGGLTTAGNQGFLQGNNGVYGLAEPGDEFGLALAAGSTNGDAYDELVVGVPGEDEGAQDAGLVHVFHGSPAGLIGDLGEVWYQDAGSVKDMAEPNDRFGRQLLCADFNGDGTEDLAVGVPSEGLQGGLDGAVHVFYGMPGGGLADSGNQLWHQDSVSGPNAVQDACEQYDQFGFAL